MYLLVYKFGGSSVADAAGLRCAAGQLAAAAAAGFHIIAVVSAQGKTTDRLLQSTAELTAHPACREADQLLATGEQASAALMAMTLQEMGLPAVSLTGWQAGIHTDGNHAAAEITALYRLPLRAVLYPVGLCLLVGLGFAVWDYRRTLKRHRALTGCGDLTAELLRELPPPESLAEEDYRAQLLHLRQLCTELQSAADNRYRDAIEYYTTWAHQIKTPIASMRLALQGEDTALFRRLLSDLSRTEQYVEMVMAFLRLEDAPGDYVFREVALDEVLRQALRRFSAEFIDRRLRLDYTPTGLTVLTDEKWLCFVLEQLLSNALKYTREGSITVELAGERVLAIRDTGIGIAPEDLPRIFEKGYTGQNGRADKRASGLGLYLCSRICRNLGVGLTVKSTSGVGTTLLLDFTQYPLRVE